MPLRQMRMESGSSHLTVVLYGGEVDPSDQGHMGAGTF